jgi:hypothetical protein
MEETNRAQDAISLLHAMIGEFFMSRTNINQIYKSALLVAFFTALVGTILFGQMHYFNPVVRATAIPQASNSYGDLRMVW